MGTRTIRIDDLDGTEAAEQLLYLVDGAFWEIDLSEANAQGFREALGKYLAVSRPLSEREGYRRMVSPYSNGTMADDYATDFDPDEVRAWCIRNGIPHNAKGRLPAHVIARYKDAHKD